MTVPVYGGLWVILHYNNVLWLYYISSHFVLVKYVMVIPMMSNWKGLVCLVLEPERCLLFCYGMLLNEIHMLFHML